MNRKDIIFLCMLLISFLCSSCEKVIDIKLNDSTPRIVIEGEVTTASGPYTVTITESKNVDQNNTFTGRADAVVTIKDITAGISEILNNAGFGNYVTSFIRGTAGHTYELTVVLGDQTYTSSSTIPSTDVKLEALYVETSSFDDKDIFMVPVFTDPAGKGNYYRLRQWVNGVLIKGSYVRSDEATDGRRYTSQLFYDTDSKEGNPLINVGDSISVELQCIDRKVYDFYRTLNATIEQDAAAPSNPLSNISGGALGVFNACRSNKLSAIVNF